MYSHKYQECHHHHKPDPRTYEYSSIIYHLCAQKHPHCGRARLCQPDWILLWALLQGGLSSVLHWTAVGNDLRRVDGGSVPASECQMLDIHKPLGPQILG